MLILGTWYRYLGVLRYAVNVLVTRCSAHKWTLHNKRKKNSSCFITAEVPGGESVLVRERTGRQDARGRGEEAVRGPHRRQGLPWLLHVRLLHQPLEREVRLLDLNFKTCVSSAAGVLNERAAFSATHQPLEREVNPLNLNEKIACGGFLFV